MKSLLHIVGVEKPIPQGATIVRLNERVVEIWPPEGSNENKIVLVAETAPPLYPGDERAVLRVIQSPSNQTP